MIKNILNSKYNTFCKDIVINDDVEYSMYDLREKYLNYSISKQLQFQEAKTVKKKTNIRFNKCTKSLNYLNS